eukprot:MONOS_124.1-p1 / transcript=MONOS_124.1 / gene=MONOS_124 / organism=Monocercomonoides_exilis_PA203 / gene_product= p97A / transcript_product= p97A / location=Mono_scaffold00002:230722-233442(-) / protein_length=907 / sequence_SO=supercontig / SO=protein_coding / is_pseudo=false
MWIVQKTIFTYQNENYEHRLEQLSEEDRKMFQCLSIISAPLDGLSSLSDILNTLRYRNMLITSEADEDASTQEIQKDEFMSNATSSVDTESEMTEFISSLDFGEFEREESRKSTTDTDKSTNTHSILQYMTYALKTLPFILVMDHLDEFLRLPALPSGETAVSLLQSLFSDSFAFPVVVLAVTTTFGTHTSLSSSLSSSSSSTSSSSSSSSSSTASSSYQSIYSQACSLFLRQTRFSRVFRFPRLSSYSFLRSNLKQFAMLPAKIVDSSIVINIDYANQENCFLTSSLSPSTSPSHSHEHTSFNSHVLDLLSSWIFRYLPGFSLRELKRLLLFAVVIQDCDLKRIFNQKKMKKEKKEEKDLDDRRKSKKDRKRLAEIPTPLSASSSQSSPSPSSSSSPSSFSSSDQSPLISSTSTTSSNCLVFNEEIIKKAAKMTRPGSKMANSHDISDSTPNSLPSNTSDTTAQSSHSPSPSSDTISHALPNDNKSILQQNSLHSSIHFTSLSHLLSTPADQITMPVVVSALRSFFLSDVVGYDSVKKQLFDILILPSLAKLSHTLSNTSYLSQYSQSSQSSQSSHSSHSSLTHLPRSLPLQTFGIILHGPSGCGKSHIASSLSSFFSSSASNIVSLPLLLRSSLGDSEKTIKQLFADCRQNRPSVLVFDHLDAVGQKRGGIMGGKSGSDDGGNDVFSRIVTQLLTEMDGISGEDAEEGEGRFLSRVDDDDDGDDDTLAEKSDSKKEEDNANDNSYALSQYFSLSQYCIVVGLCEDIKVIDPALARPGRFEHHIEIPLPEANDRKALLKEWLTPVSKEEIEKTDISKCSKENAHSTSKICVTKSYGKKKEQSPTENDWFDAFIERAARKSEGMSSSSIKASIRDSVLDSISKKDKPHWIINTSSLIKSLQKRKNY